MGTFPQYNQEIHYVEPCLNGTLVRADRTNKDVSPRQIAPNPRRSRLQKSTLLYFCQHFREHLDKLFAKGIGLLGEALAEAFTILSDVSPTTPECAQLRRFFTGFRGVIYSFLWWFV